MLESPLQYAMEEEISLSWRLQELVRKYSDYIRFPIRMEVSKTRRKEGSPDDKPERCV